MKFFSAFSTSSPRPDPEPGFRGAALPPRALLRRLEVTAKRELAGALAGEFRSRLRGRGMEFDALRPYEPGDEVRLIDWNVTARTGQPHVRLYREERSRTLTLLADLSPSMTPTKRNLLLYSAALLAFAAVHSRDRLALCAFSDRLELVVEPGLGRNHALRILSELQIRQPQGTGSDLAPALEAALVLNRRPGMLFLLCDAHVPLPEELLRRAAGRHDLLCLLLRDPAEQCPAPGGLLRVGDVETGRQRLLDLTTATARTAVNAAWAAAEQRQATTLQGLGLDHAVLSCEAPPLPALLQLFRRRREVRP